VEGVEVIPYPAFDSFKKLPNALSSNALSTLLHHLSSLLSANIAITTARRPVYWLIQARMVKTAETAEPNKT